MGKIAYFDCSAGAAGDMILASLIDAGAPLDAIKAGLLTIPAIRGEWDILTERVWRGTGLIAATKIHVSSIYDHESLPAPQHGEAAANDAPHEQSKQVFQDHDDQIHQRHHHDHDHHHGHSHDHSHHHDLENHSHGPNHDGHVDHEHRNYRTIAAMIDASEMSPWVKENSKRVFHCLGEAEASVHGTTMDKVHFHEVGAIDSLIDTIGSVLALELLHIDEVHCSFLPFSKGFVRCTHGVMPVPAPATLRLFHGIPMGPAPKGAVGELVTPTGASLMKALARTFGQPPPFVPIALGSGAGTKDFPNHANIVRVVIGTAVDPSTTVVNANWTPVPSPELIGTSDTTIEHVSVLETNVDDMNPQVFGHVQERLLQKGALDVWVQPIQMKKNRPATLMSVLCHHHQVGDLSTILFEETTTLGIRRQTMERITLRRERIDVASQYGTASVKIAYLNERVVNVQPEYEDCRALSLATQTPLKTVLATISSLAMEKAGSKSKVAARDQP
ncbi:hypothetical protein H310_01068 [Aphanomyces invadans]|uniref:Nickel insertion protein n=1 Tax=Aphanomyces invadans TaxID=157072 RepID=A0A024USA0_9STRA|nr:hypothetical protein H310_01068 [Aphanomyces invadans]ETW08503.1 hypothetical protein H310_01068 [Aphanomyces invadans]|eukprot:XP_008862308.1 hypothetical protein H310_01068 [Aphanomyces invadans]